VQNGTYLVRLMAQSGCDRFTERKWQIVRQLASHIELGEEVTLWDVMRAMLRAKEARPSVSVLPAILVLESQEVWWGNTK